MEITRKIRYDYYLKIDDNYEIDVESCIFDFIDFILDEDYDNLSSCINITFENFGQTVVNTSLYYYNHDEALKEYNILFKYLKSNGYVDSGGLILDNKKFIRFIRKIYLKRQDFIFNQDREIRKIKINNINEAN